MSQDKHLWITQTLGYLWEHTTIINKKIIVIRDTNDLFTNKIVFKKSRFIHRSWNGRKMKRSSANITRKTINQSICPNSAHHFPFPILKINLEIFAMTQIEQDSGYCNFEYTKRLPNYDLGSILIRHTSKAGCGGLSHFITPWIIFHPDHLSLLKQTYFLPEPSGILELKECLISVKWSGVYGTPAPVLSGGPLRSNYTFVQFHLHWLSEHAIDGMK